VGRGSGTLGKTHQRASYNTNKQPTHRLRCVSPMTAPTPMRPATAIICSSLTAPRSAARAGITVSSVISNGDSRQGRSGLTLGRPHSSARADIPELSISKPAGRDVGTKIREAHRWAVGLGTIFSLRQRDFCMVLRKTACAVPYTQHPACAEPCEASHTHRASQEGSRIMAPRWCMGLGRNAIMAMLRLTCSSKRENYKWLRHISSIWSTFFSE
jgi:hypothetical protein